MIRSLAAALLAAAALSSGASPAGEKLFPTGKGSAWVYKGTMGTQPLNMTAEITESSTAGGSATVNMRWFMNGQPMQDETYIATSSGVSRSRSGAYGANHIEPPITIIKYPMTVGRSWTWKGVIKTNQVTLPSHAAIKVAALESVKVGPYTVRAYRVDAVVTVEVQGQKQVIPAAYWFAPGKGMIKQTASVPLPNGKSLVIQATASSVTIK